MKPVFLLIFIVFSVSLFSQHISEISNIQFESKIVDFSKYSGSINKHEDRLYVESEEMIEEFQILADGQLQKISFYDKFHFGIATAFIIGDSLYCFEHDTDSYVMLIFNIGVSPMQFIDRIDTNINKNSVLTSAVYNQYILLPDNDSQCTLKFNRNTLSFDNQINSLYGLFTVVDSLLIVYGYVNIDGVYHTSLRFYNMNEITDYINYNSYIHTEEIGSQNNEGDIVFLKSYNNLLYLFGFNEIRVMDVTDIDTVTTVYRRFTPSNTDMFYYVDGLLHENRIFTVDNNGRFRVNDINNQNLLYEENEIGYIYPGSLCLNYPTLYRSADTEIKEYNIENELILTGRYGQTSKDALYINGHVGYRDFKNNKFVFVSVLDNRTFFIGNDNIENNAFLLSFDVQDNKLLVNYAINHDYYFEMYDISNEVPSLITSLMLDYSYDYVFLIDNKVLFCRFNQSNGRYYTEIYTLNNNEIDFLCSTIGMYNNINSFVHDEYLLFNTYNSIQFRSRSNPSDIVFQSSIPDNSVINSCFVNNEILLTRGFITQKLYQYTSNSMNYINQFEIHENSPLVYNDQIMASKNFNDEAISLYYIGNGSFDFVGSFNERRDSYIYAYPEHHKIISFGTSGVKIFSCEYTVSNDEMVNHKPQSISVYPNPCKADFVKFSVEPSSNIEAVYVYNIKGQLVKKLENSFKQKTTEDFIWDKKDQKGESVATGVYLYQTLGKNSKISGKFMILK